MRMTPSQRPGSQDALGAAFVIVVIAMIVIGWIYLSTPAPVEVARETADAKAKAKEQALLELKNKIDAEESRRLALDPAVQKHSREICAAHNDWGVRACDAVAQGQVYVGMTADQVRVSWGSPRSVNPLSIRREQWVYASRSVDFDSGIVTSFQSSR
jgi:hypothetical protein